MHVSVVLPHISGLPQDVSINTFHFGSVDTVGDRDDVADLITDFYNTDTPFAGLSVGELLGRRISRGVDDCKIKFTPLGGGSPIDERSFTLVAPVAGAAGDLPDEIAICLSFRADYSSAQEQVPAGAPGPEGDLRPRARRRGRVYLGPLVQNSVLITDPANPNFGLVGEGVMQTIGQAGARLMTESGLAGTPWCTWSETDNALRNVEAVWVDNAFDVQRRRGRAATKRYKEPGGTFV